MNQFSYFGNPKFSNPPLGFDVVAPEEIGAEKYAYSTYRHFLQPYIKNAPDLTVFDINCGRGYGLSTLKEQFKFKKCIGYNSDQNILEECKNSHSGISFYRDFIMSKQKNADIVIAIDALNEYQNKSAVLLKMKQVLNENGILYIVQSTKNEQEYANFETILEKTHGLQKILSLDITNEILVGVDRISEMNRVISANYADYVPAIQKGLKYKMTVMKNAIIS